MTRSLALVPMVVLVSAVAAAGPASGTFKASKEGAIAPKYATAYAVRDSSDARNTRVELLLSDVPVDLGEIQATLNPHMIAINADALKDRNYVLLWVAPDGGVTMNATFSKTMTQYMDNTGGGLQATLTTNSPTRVEGRVFSSAPLKTMDGTTYAVDLKFAADVAAVPAATRLPAGGGDPGKAFSALLAAATSKNWAAIKAASGASALKMFDHDYDSAAENAQNALDLLNGWVPTQKMKIAGGELRGETAILEVEGEMFPGQRGMSLVRMAKSGPKWLFEEAARVGMLP
jgi:hypothetical protein